MTWREHEARNEARFRNQNEWIDDVSDSFGACVLTAFVCECGDGSCTQTIELTKAEYESVRSKSNRFAVAPNHENPEAEVLISQGPRFAVVEKITGANLRIARATDPRSA